MPHTSKEIVESRKRRIAWRKRFNAQMKICIARMVRMGRPCSGPIRNRTMHTITSRLSRKRLLVVALATAFNMTAALAQVASGTTGIDASGNYQSEVQACRSGRTQQDTATCLREARNARADHSSGKSQATAAQLQGNAMARCEPLNGQDKAACQARVVGYGSESGSVAGGGVLNSVETVVMPAGATSVLIAPVTANPVVLTPATAR